MDREVSNPALKTDHQKVGGLATARELEGG